MPPPRTDSWRTPDFQEILLPRTCEPLWACHNFLEQNQAFSLRGALNPTGACSSGQALLPRRVGDSWAARLQNKHRKALEDLQTCTGCFAAARDTQALRPGAAPGDPPHGAPGLRRKPGRCLSQAQQNCAQAEMEWCTWDLAG